MDHTAYFSELLLLAYCSNHSFEYPKKNPRLRPQWTEGRGVIERAKNETMFVCCCPMAGRENSVYSRVVHTNIV